MATERNGLKAWVRFDYNNRPVSGSLIFQKDRPKSGVWKEYNPAGGNCNINYGLWKLVTGGSAGDGAVLVDNLIDQDFTFIGPNDQSNDGWVYLTRQFPQGAQFSIDYDYTSFDEGVIHDRPVYWVSNTQPTGIPTITTSRAESIPESGTWETSVNPGQWFSIGIYSDDSCCGRGFLSTQINTTNFVPEEAFSVTLSFPINYTSFNLRCDDINVGNYVFTDVTVNNIDEAVALFNSTPGTIQYGTFSAESENVLKLVTSSLIKSQLCPEGFLTFWVGAD